MLNIIFEGKKSKRVISFKNSFNELTVGEFCAFIFEQEKLNIAAEKLQKADEELRQLQKRTDDILDIVLILDSEINDLERQIRSHQIYMLGILSNRRNKVIEYLLNTKGITQELIRKALRTIQKELGSFSDWVPGVKLVNKFRFADYKKASPFSLTRMKTFEVFNMDNQTVLRDAAAGFVAAKIDAINDELKANRWQNLTRFIAYVCRPETEKEEISTQDKKAFFGGKKIVSLSIDDRLKAYNDLLAETVNLRAPLFDKLPLVTAIGIYKQYFFLSRR